MYVCMYVCIGTMYRIRIEFASTNINSFITYISALSAALSHHIQQPVAVVQLCAHTYIGSWSSETK